MELWLIIVIVVVFLLLVGIIIWLLKRGSKTQPQEYECPKCGALLLGLQDKCPKCGHSFLEEKHICPHCKKPVAKDASICDDCGTEFRFWIQDAPRWFLAPEIVNIMNIVNVAKCDKKSRFATWQCAQNRSPKGPILLHPIDREICWTKRFIRKNPIQPKQGPMV